MKYLALLVFLITAMGSSPLAFGQEASTTTSVQSEIERALILNDMNDMQADLDALYKQIQQIQSQFQQERQTLSNENLRLQDENSRLQAVILNQQQALDDANARLSREDVRLNKTSLKEDQREQFHKEYLRRIGTYCENAWSSSDLAQCSSDEGRYQDYDERIKGTR